MTDLGRFFNGSMFNADTFWKSNTVPDTVPVRKVNEMEVVSVDVPGFSRDDVKITVEGNVLHITGKKTVNGQERSLDIVLRIGDEYDASKCRPAVSNGVLTITLARCESDSRELHVE